MENARSSPVLGRSLTTLCRLGAVGTLTDGQLLEWFLARNDPAASEAAFSVLVERHGAMVLGICQKMLGDPHDAHDAFQATFLVLVSKARSIRRREAVGGWLFGIARRVAARAQVESSRRRRHLQALFDDQPPSRDNSEVGSSTPSEADYGYLIDEIDRLPEQLRSPVVLHYFEGLSTEAIAQRLGCPRGTVLSRLSRARSRLKERLERRDVSFASILPLGDAMSRCLPLGPVPPSLVQNTIRAARSLALAGASIESIVPATVATLSRGVIRTLAFSNIRPAAIFMVMAVACVSMGLAATFRSDEVAPQAMSKPGMSSNPHGSVAKGEKAETPSRKEGEMFTYAGLVLDPDEKPVAGAKLHLAYWPDQGPTRTEVRGTTDAQGRFGFTVTKRDFPDTDQEQPWTWAQVVAKADGFGLGWASAFEKNGKPLDPPVLTIRLARDDVPIEGRIVDLEGRAVPGATIRPRKILEPEHGDLSVWIVATKNGQDGSTLTEQAHLTRTLWAEGAGLTESLTSDAKGRFSIRGVGRERVIELEISGPTVQSKPISVLTRAAEPFKVNVARRSPDWGIIMYYGAHFTHAAAPTKPLIGVVKDKDTDQPLAGVRIAAYITAEFPVALGFRHGIETTTDQDGRYRLYGLPKGRGNQIHVIPAKNQPYLAAGREVKDTPGLDPVVLDIGLKRGIVIEGRVTDKETGKPLEALVEYHSFMDNPHLADAPGFDRSSARDRNRNEHDGSFRIVGLPGRGLVAATFRGPSNMYLEGVGIKGNPMELPVVPHGGLFGIHAFSEINPPNHASNVHCDIQLEQGVSQPIRVVDPQGRLTSGSRISGLFNANGWSPPQEAAEFRIEGLRRGETRRVQALLEGRSLAGWAEFRADGKETVELKLQPWATVVGRLVDNHGDPRVNVDLIGQRDDERHIFKTDSQGRFRIEGFAPGVPFEIWVSPMSGYISGKIAKGQVLAADETKDLGDVVEGPY